VLNDIDASSGGYYGGYGYYAYAYHSDMDGNTADGHTRDVTVRAKIEGFVGRVRGRNASDRR
jgi:hypothetical protein